MWTTATKRAYLTVLTSRNYLRGVQLLKHSLDQTNPLYPFYVLLPQNIPADMVRSLEDSGIACLYADPFGDEIINRDNKVDYWKETLFKLKVFDLTQFDKLVFLDSDMIVLNNLDHLFDHPHMSCVAAGQELHADWVDLNSGIMVIEPSHRDYLGLEALIDPVYEKKHSLGKGIGDQDIIEAYFSDWKSRPELHLDSRYNTMLGYAGYLRKNGTIRTIDDLYVYHYTGREKPWRGSLREDIAILLKILKRSKSLLDLKVFLRYKAFLRKLAQ